MLINIEQKHPIKAAVFIGNNSIVFGRVSNSKVSGANF